MINKTFKGLSNRYARSYESRDERKVSTIKALNFKKFENIELYKVEEGDNTFDILPYEIKTKNHPLVRTGEASVGEWDYLLDYFVHKNIGAGNAQVICLKSTFGKPCPICDQQSKYFKQGKEEEAKALKPSRRVCYNVLDHRDGKVKIFDVSHYLFEKELIEEARNGKDGSYVMFSDPDKGKTISFRATLEKSGKNEYFKFKSFKFLNRDPISEDILEKTLSLDEALSIPTFEEVERIFYNSDDVEDDGDMPSEQIDEVEDVVRPVSSPNKETQEEPKKEAEPERVEAERKAPKKSDNPCPFGHVFAKDAKVFPDCDDCELWDKCCKAHRQ